MASHSDSTLQPAPKRSLFKKLAPVEPVEEDEGIQLFSRSKEIFPDIIAEKERRRKKLDHQKSDGSAEPMERSIPDGKRRRISQESNEAGRHSSDDEITSMLLHGRRSSAAATSQPTGASSATTSPKQNRSPASKSKFRQGHVDQRTSHKSKTPQPAIIALSDSEDDAIKTGKTNPKPQPIDLNFDSDVEEEVFQPPRAAISPVKEVFEVEEFPEYVAKAREGAARKVFGRLDPAQSNARSDSISSNESNSKLETSSNAHLASMPRSAPDPVVQILVSSPIEGTRPLMVRRKLSQRLKDVKFAWCDKQVLDGQPVSEEVKSLIFLTWRGNKVFDVTTCKALGLTADASGRLIIDGEGFDEEGRVHLVAWTQELFDEFKRQKAAERKRLILNPLEEEEEEESTAMETQPEEQIQNFRIILKAKDRTEFKIKVVSSTAVSKIIGAYRKHHKIPDNVNISLYLDGDKLDPNGVMADADLDEMTTIDVHVGQLEI